MKIVFQNENFVVIDKPEGMLSVPARESSDPRAVAGRLLEHELGRQIFPVHRLDEEVSGLVLYALNSQWHRQANEWFESKKVQKKYQAFCAAVDITPFESKGVKFESMNLMDVTKSTQEFEWSCLLLRGKRRAYEHATGKKSLTRARFCGFADSGLLTKTAQSIHVARFELWPITGRSHQLRFEMFRHGWPILGDELYGASLESSSYLCPSSERCHQVDFGSGIALRAVEIDLQFLPEEKRGGLPAVLTVSALF